MSRVLLSVPALIALTTTPHAAAQTTRLQEVTVELTVIAPTRDAALQQAVTLGIDALIARATTPGTPIAARARQAIPTPLARIARIIREGNVPQGYTVTAVIALPAGTAERAVLAQRPDLARTRIAVLVPESVLRRPIPDPAAETELSRALVRSGLTVVDLPTTAHFTERELLRAGPLTNEARLALQARLNVDILVTGEAFAEEYGSVSGGTRAYTSRLEVKVIDLSSGQILHSEAYQASGIGATDAVAGKTALMNAGRQAGERLPGALYLALQGTGPTAPRAYTLRVTPPVTFGPVDRLLTTLRGLPGVGGASLRHLDQAGAVLDLTYTGAAADLAAQLERAGLAVTGLNGLDVTVHF